MFKACKCKICNLEITVEMNDEYAEMGDHHKLVKMATCNRCYDIRDNRLKAERQIFQYCRTLTLLPKEHSASKQKLTDKIRAGLMAATRFLAQSFTDFYRSGEILWDEEFVNLLMDKPDKAGKVLHKYQQDCQTLLAPKQIE